MTKPAPSLYNLKLLAPNHFAMAKFSSDFEVEAVYELASNGRGDYSCSCPANLRSVVLKKCKHRRMLPLMLGAVNTDRFFDPASGSWHQPLGDLARPEAKPEVACTCASMDECNEREGCQNLAANAETDEIANALVSEANLISSALPTPNPSEQPAEPLGVSTSQAQARVAEQPQQPVPTSAPTLRRR